MTIATDLVVDRIPRVDGTQEPLASWYTQGLSDGLGDRLLMFDNSNAPSWELLRFRPEFVSTPGFERALRDRVEQLGHFRHPLFTHVRAVEELGFGDGLALVATYAPGRRLSEALVRPRSVGAVIPLIRQLTSALADLQDQGADVAHGALTADRIMVARDGRLIIREHVIGSALARLRLPAGRLWTDLGIMAWPTHLAVPTLDRRTDVVQLALVALSLMLGRRVGPADYPRRIDDLLDRIARVIRWAGLLILQGRTLPRGSGSPRKRVVCLFAVLRQVAQRGPGVFGALEHTSIQLKGPLQPEPER